MNKEQAIIKAKEFRKRADDLLQEMKEHRKQLIQNALPAAHPDGLKDGGEVIAQHIISIRDLESCIMRQGMVLKYIGTPDPYPNSKDPSNTVVEPTADGLKL